MVRERRYTPSRQFVWIALFLSSYCCRSTASALPQVDLVFETPSQLRFRPVSDGVSSIFPLIRRPFRDTGRQHRSARIFVNSRNLGQLNYAWLFPSSTLSLDIRLLCVKGDSQSTKPRAMKFKCAATPVPGRWVERFEKSIRSIDGQFVNSMLTPSRSPGSEPPTHHQRRLKHRSSYAQN